MKKVIFVLFFSLFSFLTLYGNAKEPHNVVTGSANYQEVYEFCEKNIGVVGLYEDIRGAFLLVPELEELLHKKDTLNSLKYISQNNFFENNTELINALINYIESDYEITLLQELLQSSYTSIILNTLCGKTIAARTYSGNETPSYSLPNYTYSLVQGASYAYNCHAFAWYYGGNYSANNNMWIDNCHAYYSAPTCYSTVYSDVFLSQINSSNLQVGDIVVYWAYSDEYLNTSAQHSAVVTEINGGNITVTSKWGATILASHAIDQCPYYYAQYITNPNSIPRKLSVFRCNHSINPNLGVNQHYLIKDDSCHYLLCPYCDRGLSSMTEEHTYNTLGAITICTKCHYRAHNVINRVTNDGKVAK